MKAEKRAITLDSAPDVLFAALCDRPGAFFLDTALEAGGLGRYSFIGFDPFLWLTAKDGEVLLERNGGVQRCTEAPLVVLRRLMREHACEPDAAMPFPGGAVGYFSYEFGAKLEQVRSEKTEPFATPEIELGFYDGGIMFDRQTSCAAMVAVGSDAAAREAVFARLTSVLNEARGHQREFVALKSLSADALVAATPREDYLAAVARIKDYIAAGDIYQANLTQSFDAPLTGHPYELYRSLRLRSPAPFASYFRGRELVLVSSSPERFLQVRDGVAETRPIKGTRPRRSNAREDKLLADELAASAKDRAELLMIVDLERNDLGRVCEPGSIVVEDLFKVEQHPTVHHLVATVRGKLRSDCDVVDCLRAALPGGSITGAPKVRAMQIIVEVEPVCRGPYTGAIGYLGFDGGCDLAIAIRTLLCTNDRVFYHVGAGIVADSDPVAEYQETLDKGAAMRAALCAAPASKSSYADYASVDGRIVAAADAGISPLSEGFMFGQGLFETLRVDGGRVRCFDGHWSRLTRSATALGLTCLARAEELLGRCEAVRAANRIESGSLKVMIYQSIPAVGEVILARSGLYPKETYARGFRLTIERAVDRGSHAAHKTLNYLGNIEAKRRAMASGWDEPLFVAERGEVLEGATTNVFAVCNGHVVTPPTDGRILPGVARQKILRLLGGRAEEHALDETALLAADEVFVTNALLGVMPVAQIGTRAFDLHANPVTRELMAEWAKLA